MTFTTITGSLYEIDTIYKRIRRLSNSNNLKATERQGNSEWRTYDHLSDIVVNRPVTIWWTEEVELLKGSPPEAKPVTITSYVTEYTVDVT